MSKPATHYPPTNPRHPLPTYNQRNEGAMHTTASPQPVDHLMTLTEHTLGILLEWLPADRKRCHRCSRCAAVHNPKTGRDVCTFGIHLDGRDSP